VLRLFHFLVKFGYYGSDDIKALLRPLIAVLDCKHDKPFPHDSDKGYSKESQKLVQLYRTKDRYEPSEGPRDATCVTEGPRDAVVPDERPLRAFSRVRGSRQRQVPVSRV